jgi:hypothetical protein
MPQSVIVLSLTAIPLKGVAVITRGNIASNKQEIMTVPSLWIVSGCAITITTSADVIGRRKPKQYKLYEKEVKNPHM